MFQNKHFASQNAVKMLDFNHVIWYHSKGIEGGIVHLQSI